MTKRAIKILLALAVMIATFAVITVVASAENRFVERDHAKDYIILDGITFENLEYSDIPFVLISKRDLTYSDLYFEELCSTAPYSIYYFSGIGADSSSTEDGCFWSDDDTSETLYYDLVTLYYCSSDSLMGSHFMAVYVCFIYNFDSLTFTADSSGGSSGGSSETPDVSVPDSPSYSGDANSGSGRDSYPWIYDPTSKYTTDFFDEYYNCGVVDLYSFYLISDVSYEYFFEDCLKYLTSHLSSPGNTYSVYDIYQCGFYLPDRSFYSYQSPYEELSLPEGEYYLMIEVECSCSACSGYEYFGLKVISTPTLTSDPAANYEAYNRGYQSGYRDGYNNAKVGQDLLIQQNRNEAYESGFERGEISGRDSGYSEGYDYGWSVGFADGESSGDLSGYDRGYTEGYRVGNSAGYKSGYNSCELEFASSNIEQYTIGYQNGMKSVIDNEGDAISGFFVGTTSSILDALQLADDRIVFWGLSILDLVAFGLFVIVAAGIVMELIKKFI